MLMTFVDLTMFLSTLIAKYPIVSYTHSISVIQFLLMGSKVQMKDKEAGLPFFFAQKQN